jgi:hypothetical protein
LSDLKDRYNAILSSTEFKKNTYIRRVMGVLVIALLPIFMTVAFIANRYLGINSYLACTLAGFAILIVSATVANRKAKNKFGEN